jgi:hypothetical protein
MGSTSSRAFRPTSGLLDAIRAVRRFASDGEEVIHPEPARFDEVPIELPLPEGLDSIP